MCLFWVKFEVWAKQINRTQIFRKLTFKPTSIHLLSTHVWYQCDSDSAIDSADELIISLVTHLAKEVLALGDLESEVLTDFIVELRPHYV